MFYVPLKLREWKEPCVPRGPNFARAQAKKIRIDGTEICFHVPRNRARSHETLMEPKRTYSLENPYMLGDERWVSMTLMRRVWDFYGPWFLGAMAGVDCHVGLIQQSDKRSDVSYFHPRVLESAIADLMASSFDEVDTRRFEGQVWFAPVQWQPMENFPSPAVQFVAQANKAQRPYRDDEYYLVFPVHHNYLVSVCLSVWRSRKFIDGEAVDDLEPWIPLAPMKTLVDQVLASFSVTLSPLAQAQMREAQEGLSDTSLAKEFAPVNVLEYERSQGIVKKRELFEDME